MAVGTVVFVIGDILTMARMSSRWSWRYAGFVYFVVVANTASSDMWPGNN